MIFSAAAGFRLTRKPVRRSLVINDCSKRLSDYCGFEENQCDWSSKQNPIIQKIKYTHNIRSNTLAMRVLKRMCINQKKTLNELKLDEKKRAQRLQLFEYKL